MNWNEKGFSLTEIVVALGLLGGIGLVATTITSQMSSQQSALGIKSDAQMFMASFNKFLMSPKGCEALTKTASGTARKLKNIPNLEITGFSGFGVKATSTLKKNTQISRGILLKELELEKVVGTETPVTVGGESLKKAMMRVKYKLEIGDRNISKVLDLPVMTDSAGFLRNCTGAGSIDDSSLCTMAGMAFDATTGLCTAQETCQVKGSYSELSCRPEISSFDGYTCEKVTSGFNATRNPVTNAFSCPDGATPVVSSRVSGSHDEETGKKSSVKIYDYETYYICMECPEPAGGSSPGGGGLPGGGGGGGGPGGPGDPSGPGTPGRITL